jgi:hypothetical protein
MPSKPPLPPWIPPQLTQLVQAAPSGPQWLHEIKLDGFRMAARIERGRATLLTRTGLDWSAKYPIFAEPPLHVGREALFEDRAEQELPTRLRSGAWGRLSAGALMFPAFPRRASH